MRVWVLVELMFKIESSSLSDKIIFTWCYGPPESCTNFQISVTDDDQRDEILDADTDAVVDGVEEEDGGLLGHEAEWRLLLVLPHDAVGVEHGERGREREGYRPDGHQDNGSVQLPRSVTQGTGDP